MGMIRVWLVILLLSVYQTAFSDYLLINPDFYQLNGYTWEEEAFRRMKLGEYVLAQPDLDGEILAALMVEHDYDLGGLTAKEYQRWPVVKAAIMARKPAEYRKLAKAYQMVFGDIGCFPIPMSSRKGNIGDAAGQGGEAAPFPVYQDSFLEPRTYQGERQHEGCDILGTERPRGFYPVLSMTGGVVEQVGWLELGGWRIGIRAPSGAYFYYAHLYQYDQDWQKGDPVYPGTLLGYMGDSGYGIQENTVGNFDIHLHLGIYLPTDHYEELSINPYWVLKYSERFLRKADY